MAFFAAGQQPFCRFTWVRSRQAPDTVYLVVLERGAAPRLPHPCSPVRPQRAPAMQKHTKNGNKPLSALADTQIDLGAYRIADPEAFGRNFLRLMDESTRPMQG